MCAPECAPFIVAIGVAAIPIGARAGVRIRNAEIEMNIVSVIWLAIAAAAAPNPGGFERYEAIIARKPFGEENRTPAANAALPPGAESFFKDIKLTAIVESPAGPQAGLLNVKTQKSYLMSIGDMEDGMELLDADYVGERAKLQAGAEIQWLQLGGAPAAAAPPAGMPGPSVGSAPPGTDAAAAGRRLSYAERRAMLEAERQKRIKEATQPLSGEPLKEYLKQYQMELIRAGGQLGPPLPIPLTPEMDRQLVNEGVLPPIESVPPAQ